EVASTSTRECLPTVAKTLILGFTSLKTDFSLRRSVAPKESPTDSPLSNLDSESLYPWRPNNSYLLEFRPLRS
ncbi:hypothetical protein ILYODFUR_036408, partial [Ilyodon furcidens]